MGKLKKDLQFWESAYMNNSLYVHYYNRLMELAISRFEWKDLPNTVDERFLELTLFAKGFSIFFKDELLEDSKSNVTVIGNATDSYAKDSLLHNGSYLALSGILQSRLNVYNVPINRRAIASSGYTSDMLDDTNSVIIFNNYIHTPSMKDIELFAKQLYEIDSSIRVNAKAQKTPIAILCDENDRLTMLNLYKQYDGNTPYIFGTKNLDLNNIKSVTTGAPYVADRLYDLKTQVWNEALTYLGISNINVVKKERLISDEVTRNQGGVVASRFSPLGMRQQACKQINEMFGLNVSVDYREDYQELLERKSEEIIQEIGDTEIGGVHNE